MRSRRAQPLRVGRQTRPRGLCTRTVAPLSVGLYVGGAEDRAVLLAAAGCYLLDLAMQEPGTVPADTLHGVGKIAEQVARGAKIVQVPVMIAIPLGERVGELTGWRD